jgi:2-polyprenyl-6-methoxyphenol hydroxylase-like FAD-dependent oxidoreductase
MPAIHNALIVGGGIGGLTAAVALRRAGVNVDLVEIKKEWWVYGVGIIQPNNTLRALERVGLADVCVERGAAFPGWRIFDAEGNFLMEAPTSNLAAPHMPPINGITRPLLHQVLVDAMLASGVNARLSCTVADLRDIGDEVAVAFTDGSTGGYDLVVGCDGVHSNIRERLFGCAHMPRYSGQAVWRYNLPRPARVAWGEVYFGPDTKVGLVPLSPSLMYMFLVTQEPAGTRIPEAELAREMRHRLRRYDGLVGELRELIVDPTAVVERPLEHILVPKPWYRGRVLLIGDAAHATTPHLAQGAAMAIEDAVLLGELLERTAPIDALLAEFMSRRFERAKFVVDTSRQLSEWELEQWSGLQNPAARPGELLHTATQALMNDY